MRIAIWTVTRGAVKSALKIKEKNPEADVYSLKKFNVENSLGMDDFTATLNSNFKNYDIHIFIMATGIVVRKIADLIESKDIDPAVLVVDEGMRFVISLLSGHLGGANNFAEVLNKQLQLVPIITTSSDVTGKIAVDTLSQKLDSDLKSLEDAKKVTALIVDGKNVELKLPKNISDENPEGIIVVSNREKIEMVQMYPRNLVIGLGCRRGILKDQIYEFLMEILKKHNLSYKSIKHFATVDLKADEVGLIELAKELDRELKIIGRDEILKIEDMFDGSDFVKKEIGVRAVSEPCAYLSSKKDGKFVEMKAKKDGMTISIYENSCIK